MSITAIVRALVSAGATPEMIAAAVEAAESERERVEREKAAAAEQATKHRRELGAERQRRPSDANWYRLRQRVFQEKGLTCTYCGSPATEVDHVIAWSRGGEDSFDNLVPCCKPCNSSKRHSDVSEWAGRQ